MKKFPLFMLAMLFVLSIVSASEYVIYTELIGKSQFLDESGKLTGSSVDIVREIQNRLGDTTEIKEVPWARGYNELQMKDNVILFSTTLTDERRDMFKWAGPVLREIWAFYVKKDSGVVINSLDDAKGLKRIGTYREDAREQYLISQGFENIDSNTDSRNNVKKLQTGRVDAVIDSPVSFANTCRNSGLDPDDFEQAFIVKDVNLYITFSKDFNEEAFLSWRDTLEGLYTDGKFAEIYQKWYPDSPLPEFTIVE